ncbi:MAG: hypothetical protein Tsb0017_05460 [Geothermobacteraceae bacterium]
MSVCRWLAVISSAVLLLTLPAWGTGRRTRPLPPYEYGTVVLSPDDPTASPVPFRHWVHRSRHTCRLCHVDIGFAMQAGQTEITCEQIKSGLWCGVCHNGRVAFGIVSGAGSTCERCHSPFPVGRDRKIRAEFEKLSARLPAGRFGNGVDWAAASRKGLLKPLDFLEGVSFDRPRLENRQGDVSLDARLNGLPDILFSHREHAVWNSCDLCHPDLFILKSGQTRFTMRDLFAGRFCGFCHGSVAFPLKDCGRCHSKPVRQGGS